MKNLVIFGLNTVIEALMSGAAVESVHIAVGLRNSTRKEIERIAHERGVRVLKAPRRELDGMAAGGVHQGVVAVWGLPPKLSLIDLVEKCEADRESNQDQKGKRTMLVCLDEVQDPRNLGALARSAYAFGAGGIVMPERRSSNLTPAAIKASAGALCQLPVVREKNLGRALERLKDKGFWVAGAVVEGGRAPWEFEPGDKVALVLGSEGGGLRSGIVNKLDYKVKIPMSGLSESLNVSVAGAVLMYEWLGRPLNNT